MNCGDCTALVFINNHRTCDDYCKAQGLKCKGAREEIDDSCNDDGQDHYTCEYDWSKHDTADAICECSLTSCANVQCSIDICEFEGCNDQDIYLCTDGGAINGRHFNEEFWMNTSSCTSCCDTNTCESMYFYSNNPIYICMYLKW